MTGLSGESAYRILRCGEPGSLFVEASKGDRPYDHVPSDKVIVRYILRCFEVDAEGTFAVLLARHLASRYIRWLQMWRS